MKVGEPRNPVADGGVRADAAIARVLAAERSAREAIGAAQHRVVAIAEAARRDAAARAARSEARVGRIVAAFERRTADELAAIDAEIAALAQPAPLDDADRSRVRDAVRALARELVGGDG